MSEKTSTTSMDSIISLCKRRGFIFQSSEIYGGINGFFDYGPLGVEMRNNIKHAWWQDMVQRRDDMVGLDCSIIMHPNVWKASGHVDGFSDPMVDCKESKMRYRADQLYWGPVVIDGQVVAYVSLLESPDMQELADEAANKIKRKNSLQGKLEPVVLKDYTEATEDLYEKIPSPATGVAGSLTPPRDFNLMFQTYVGALRNESAVAYLRPETAQGIFANFKNVTDTSRVKVPFGIAQIGKAFRNEITPRNFIFRSREFEQMEIEYFIAPDADWNALHQEWIETRLKWHESVGLSRNLLGLHVHPKEKLAHYARACTDITFNFPFGKQELEGIAARGNYDLSQHQNASGKSLEYFNEADKQKFLPHVIEPSLGVDRVMLALLCAAYAEEEVPGDNGKSEMRTLLRLHPRIAPVKAAVLPLVKNKPEIVQKARAIHSKLQRRWNVYYDESGAVGRRYRRQDEIGTPFGITIDFESLDDNCVTIRDRDTLKQTRIHENEIAHYIEEAID